MNWKKVTSIALSLAMVLLSVIGICEPGEVVKATVSSTLPTVSGLYVAEYFDWDGETNKVKTDTDASGNTLLVNDAGEQIRYNEQDNPDYLTDGIKDGWGQGFDNNDEKWFDYIQDGKVTHVAPSELTVTHLDGSACEDITIEAKEDDPRIAVFRVKKLESVKISYKGATVNNALIAEFALRRGLYTSETMSLESQVTGDVNVAEGQSKDLYLHLTDSWEDARFRLDTESAVKISYWDEEKREDVELSGTDTEEFVSLKPVSESDPHHLIYRVTLQGKKPSDNDGYDFRVYFKEFDVNKPSDEWEEDRGSYIRVMEADTLYASDVNNLTVKGDRYVYPDNAWYSPDHTYEAGNTTNAVYAQFKYTDKDCNLVEVTDPAMFSVYRCEYDESAEKDVYTRVDSSVVRIEKAYTDSAIMKITYLGGSVDSGNEYAVTYNGAEPKDDISKNIRVMFAPAHFNEVGTYLSAKISDSAYATEAKTDGTADLAVYAVTVDFSNDTPWNQIQSVELDRFSLTDGNGNDLSAKVQTDKNVTLTEETGRSITYGEKITIPKGTLSTSARLQMHFNIHAISGDGRENDYDVIRNVFFFYSAPTIAPAAETKPVAPAAPVSIANVAVSGINASYSYTGKEQKPVPVVKLSGKILTANKDYTYTYSNNKAVGKATITIKGIGSYTGQTTVTFKISKAKNPLTLKVTKKTYSRKKDLKKKKSLNIGVQKAKGTVTYTLDKKAKKAKITVSKKGKVTIPKNCKKGTYTITVKAKGNANYLSAKKTVKIQVKK